MMFRICSTQRQRSPSHKQGCDKLGYTHVKGSEGEEEGGLWQDEALCHPRALLTQKPVPSQGSSHSEACACSRKPEELPPTAAQA